MSKSIASVSLLIFFLLCNSSSYGQEENFIFGQLIDSTQNESIPFATIRVKNEAMGVISNVDGTFKIPIRFKTLGEIIEISCLGFRTKDIFIDNLNIGKNNIILLEPAGFQLQEAVVSANIKRLTAKQIVRIAAKSIPQNYAKEKFEIVGYYRDYQVKNGNYSNLSEAIINIQDEGFSRKHILRNQYQLYSYNQNRDFEIDSFARQPYDYKGFNKVVPNAKMKNEGGNEFITLRMHDAIRNYGLESFSFVDSISSTFIDNHQFQMVRKIDYNKETVYEINLAFENDHYRADGKIFVNTDDFSIHKLDYALFKRAESLQYSSAENASERFTNGFKKTPNEMLYQIQIEYTRGAGSKMFLNYISFYNKFLVHRPAAFKSKFLINLNDRSFRIRLNKIPTNLDKIKIKDFRFTYKDELLPIKEFYFLVDERTLVFCPRLNFKETADTIEYMFTANNSLQIADVKFDHGNIKDNLGNTLDERKWEYIHQYREFFAQEVKLLNNKKFDNEDLMVKNLPLESSAQPIKEEGLKNEYWKNTPLPVLKN